jgi:hypothetical protein
VTAEETAMYTDEIPRNAWVRSLNEFTSAHEGWLVSLDVLGAELGAQPEIDKMPLLGISADRADDDGTVAVSVARSASAHYTRIIEGVTRIYIQRTDDAAEAALQIESADGTKTIVRVRAPVLSQPLGRAALR